TPNGTGEVNISKVDIDSGTIDDVTITGGSLTSKVISKGTLDIRIAGASGTVTTAADKQTVTSSAVHGVSVGDAVKLPSGAAGADEVFTVATVTSSTIFVLDTVSTTQLTSASVAYKDDNLFVVQNGDAVNRLVVDPTGNLTIEGDLVVNGTTTTVNSTVVTVDDAIIQLGDLDATPAAGNVTADMGISWARVSGTGPYTRDYGFMGWDESKDEVSIKSGLTSTPAGNIGGSYAPINVEHVRINGSSINRDAQWQKIYDEIWASAIGDTSGVPDSITSAMQDKFLMVKRNGSVGSYTYDFEMTDTLDGGTW
ncbi:MAG TPA: hypothetical protein EYP92_04130, partial [Candidatus Thioglobus sp.]|nr:hypothetical protein [Candidatus Thioglobus sp.]